MSIASDPDMHFALQHLDYSLPIHAFEGLPAMNQNIEPSMGVDVSQQDIGYHIITTLSRVEERTNQILKTVEATTQDLKSTEQRVDRVEEIALRLDHRVGMVEDRPLSQTLEVQKELLDRIATLEAAVQRPDEVRFMTAQELLAFRKSAEKAQERHTFSANVKIAIVGVFLTAAASGIFVPIIQKLLGH